MCCSLTPLIQGCSSANDGTAATNAPAPQLGLQSVELNALIQKSERPYVLVNFFATWCKPCRAELPELVAMQHDPKSEVKVLLVSIDNAEVAQSSLKGFLGQNGIDFQTYACPGNETALITAFYPFWDNRIPLSLVFNHDGKLLETITGMTDRSEIELIVNKHKRLGS